MTAGEHWAADQLQALRAAHFTGSAWWRFLVASWHRAGETRRARPALARQARAWSATGFCAGLAAVAGARQAGITAPRPAEWTVWWLATTAMLGWHLGMVEGPEGRGRERLGGADALTLARAGLVPFIAAQGSEPNRDRAPFASLLVLAAATDVVDGSLARSSGSTRLGRDVDAATDALVGLAASRAARRAGWLTPSAARLAIARYALPVGAVTATYFRTGRRLHRTAVGADPWAANAVLAALIASPTAPRLASVVARAGSLATLALAAARSRGPRPIHGGWSPSTLAATTE